MRRAKFHALILSLFTAASVWAADTPAPEPKDPKLEQARNAIGKQDWAGAQNILREAVARNPQSADYHNLYAYSIRKGANPAMDLVFRH